MHDIIASDLQYLYVKDMFPLMKILLHSYSKFKIESRRERVAMVCVGAVLWYLLGLCSEVYMVRKKRRRPKKNDNDAKDDSDDEDNVDDDIVQQLIDEEIAGMSEKLFQTEYGSSNEYTFEGKYPLVHAHGGPIRDFTIYGCWNTFDTKFAGAFDEKREEGSRHFQLWQEFRKTFRKRAPLLRPVSHLLGHHVLRAKIPSKRWTHSQHHEDTRYSMCDIIIDRSMLALSPRLYPTLKCIFDKMQNKIQMNHINGEKNWNVFDYFCFYEDGSFIVLGDCHRDAREEHIRMQRTQSITISTDGVFSSDSSKKCNHDTWNKSAQKLHEKAQKRCSRNGGLHLS